MQPSYGGVNGEPGNLLERSTSWRAIIHSCCSNTFSVYAQVMERHKDALSRVCSTVKTINCVCCTRHGSPSTVCKCCSDDFSTCHWPTIIPWSANCSSTSGVSPVSVIQLLGVMQTCWYYRPPYCYSNSDVGCMPSVQLHGFNKRMGMFM